MTVYFRTDVYQDANKDNGRCGREETTPPLFYMEGTEVNRKALYFYNQLQSKGPPGNVRKVEEKILSYYNVTRHISEVESEPAATKTKTKILCGTFREY